VFIEVPHIQIDKNDSNGKQILHFPININDILIDFRDFPTQFFTTSVWENIG
jgi:hypothetical protein